MAPSTSAKPSKRQIGPSGQSESRRKTLTLTRKVFAKFQTWNADLPNDERGAAVPKPDRTLEDLSVDELINKEMWQSFAYYLVDVHMTSDEVHLMEGTALQYLNSVLNQALVLADSKATTTGPMRDKVYKFKTCLEGAKSQLEEARWLTQVRCQMKRRFFCRTSDEGGTFDASPDPMTIEHVKEVIKAYASYGGGEEEMRGLAVALTWLSGGRCEHVVRGDENPRIITTVRRGRRDRCHAAARAHPRP